MKKITAISILLATIAISGCLSDDKNSSNSNNNPIVTKPVEEVKPIPKPEFSDFIKGITEIPVNEREKYYLDKKENILKTFEFPVITGTSVTFFYENPTAAKVEVYGDINDWSRNGNNTILTKIEGTSLFYKVMNFEENARLRYKFIVDKKEIIDPLCKKADKGGFDSNSYFEMPKYNFLETKYYPDIPHGKLEVKYLVNDTRFGKPEDKRKIQIYLPPNYDSTKKHKVVYYQDGTDFVEKSKIPNVLDYMINKGELEPIIAVFTDWLSRDNEYLWYKQEYLDFLLKEVVSMVDSNYSTLAEAKGRVIAGASNGGEFSTFVGVKASDKFMYVINQSGVPAFGLGGRDWGMDYATEKLNVKVFSCVGKYEKAYNRDGAERLHNYLKNNPGIIGEKLVYYNEGHSYEMWGDSMREALLFLFYDKGI